mmetsp:Transcript_22557/g.49416  ORF Transcript_22557/g.49416 Transcript_22557/m.49416 type:complete len:408 (-) Transcript_22557:318-1541(-)|eukprot:CAMPEP_0118931386 /NCGR_PEP_ID=MMETSP1169-20130426/7747_1 /TAXON_ID=36882 /ORGANISM="Pyramimonas obovata, Strain CCMP722" /LENGTH=407 /DNA_ID=CAMNT_0006873883 /DNA_START=172 /DNA_END=1395 /DNA_ORIENTATION=-
MEEGDGPAREMTIDKSSTDHLDQLLQQPAPKDESKNETSLALRLSFVAGQILLGTFHVILVHSSSARPTEDNQSGDEATNDNTNRQYKYSAVLVILLAEILKLVLSILGFAWVGTRTTESLQTAKNQLHAALTPKRFLRFGLPALVYTIENHIRFAVLKELASPVTWVVFSHTEIPIVALMTVFCLNRRLTRAQWISVILLVDGVMASQVAICESRLGVKCEHLSDFPLAALCMVLLSALMAATAGTAVEYLFKEEYSTSIHLQNAQLYIWGIFSNLTVLMVQEQESIQRGTLWDGIDLKVIMILVTMALQGLCVAAVVKHMSNVAKVYASACGLFVAAIMSAIMSDFDVTLPFALAAVVVCCALYLYHMDKGDQLPAGTMSRVGRERLVGSAVAVSPRPGGTMYLC